MSLFTQYLKMMYHAPGSTVGVQTVKDYVIYVEPVYLVHSIEYHPTKELRWTKNSYIEGYQRPNPSSVSFWINPPRFKDEILYQAD